MPPFLTTTNTTPAPSHAAKRQNTKPNRETQELMHMYPKKVEVIRDLEPVVEGMVRDFFLGLWVWVCDARVCMCVWRSRPSDAWAMD